MFMGIGPQESHKTHWYVLEAQHRTHEWSRRFLECSDDHLMIELIKENMNELAVPDKDTKKKFTRGKSKVRWSRRNSETLSEHAGIELGKMKSIWSWIWWRKLKGNKKDFYGYICKKEEEKKYGPTSEWGSECDDRGAGKNVFAFFFALVFTGKSCCKESMATQTSRRVQKSPEELP